ncbi:hypothetical protein [Polaribacter ponticola]|uniref:Uncharacterized protein n=1 Tax=Polaribacter ponticola TaxID=2978475 RepID=A0ABT5S7F7_9FLAO|nr:hypothetical protein [Polaribacter sp. MSW5]MDD7913441.1 hypothetical protein [Polaribacter sp. MSW5]
MSIFKHNKLKINLKIIHCPKCNEEQPKIRKPKGWTEILWGGNTCKNCGCKMDRLGNEREK